MKEKEEQKGGMIPLSTRISRGDAEALEALRISEHPRLKVSELLQAAVSLYLEASRIGALDPFTLRPQVTIKKSQGQHEDDKGLPTLPRNTRKPASLPPAR